MILCGNYEAFHFMAVSQCYGTENDKRLFQRIRSEDYKIYSGIVECDENVKYMQKILK